MHCDAVGVPSRLRGQLALSTSVVQEGYARTIRYDDEIFIALRSQADAEVSSIDRTVPDTENIMKKKLKTNNLAVVDSRLCPRQQLTVSTSGLYGCLSNLVESWNIGCYASRVLWPYLGIHMTHHIGPPNPLCGKHDAIHKTGSTGT